MIKSRCPRVGYLLVHAHCLVAQLAHVPITLIDTTAPHILDIGACLTCPAPSLSACPLRTTSTYRCAVHLVLVSLKDSTAAWALTYTHMHRCRTMLCVPYPLLYTVTRLAARIRAELGAALRCERDATFPTCPGLRLLPALLGTEDATPRSTLASERRPATRTYEHRTVGPEPTHPIAMRLTDDAAIFADAIASHEGADARHLHPLRKPIRAGLPAHARSRFALLHERQRTARFEGTLWPPWASGMTWSSVRSSRLPHRAQILT